MCVFSPLTDRALREPDRALRVVQGRAADGQCSHDRGRALRLSHVRLLGWIKHWRYIIVTNEVKNEISSFHKIKL